ncbi:radical SAM protein [Candidatus Falkowbacteria bacterium]|nr:radical SAM protein [Candidatus Falkowbacteria bacterium]
MTPIQIDLNVTNNCDFHCPHCGFDSGNLKMQEMDLSFVKKILDDFKMLGGEKVDFTGGEPLLYAGLDELIGYAARLGLRTKIVTNAGQLNKEKLLALKAAGLNGVSISVDGASYETFNQIRPVSRETYERVIKNIRDCVGLGLFTKINTVIFQNNINDIENIVKQAIELSVQEIRFCFFSPLGRGKECQHLVASPTDWLKITRNVLPQYAKQIKIVTAIPIIESAQAAESCLAKDLSFLQIFPNGDAYPCAIMASQAKPLINLRQTSLTEFWKNKNPAGGNYWQEQILPLFQTNEGCVDYCFKNLVKDGTYKFVCPSRKFIIN